MFELSRKSIVHSSYTQIQETMNCWEFKKCGREKGGNKVAELGVCPASTEAKIDGIHNGKNGGRCCWAVAGTLCGGEVQGGFGLKVSKCLECDFYQNTWLEEQGDSYRTPTEIIKVLRAS